jgi:GR25 family glycosyltransferase involved in LPS biosynthesis
MELLKHTLFINLDHRTDRLEHVTKQLKQLDISGQRFNAVKMKKGHIGCTLSHIKCLETAIKNEWDYVFICEDDIVFTKPKVLNKNIKRFYRNPDINWDVLIIGGNNCPPYTEVTDYCIKVFSCQTTTGYIVKKAYYQILLDNFKEGLGKLLKDPDNKREFAIDMYWKRLQQKDNWFLLTPPTVIQLEDYSDIESRVVKYDHLMLDLDKKWLA